MTNREPSSHDIDSDYEIGAGLPLVPYVDLGRAATRALNAAEITSQRVFTRGLAIGRRAVSITGDLLCTVATVLSNDVDMRDCKDEPLDS